MKRREIIGGLFWLVAGLFLTGLSATYPLGNFKQPGPGFLPLGLGLLLCVFASVLLVKAWRVSEGLGKRVTLLPPGVKNVFLVVVILLAAVTVFESLGYHLTFLLLCLLLTLLTGWMKWRASLVFTVLVVLGVYVIFVWLLKQPLPAGFLGE